MAQRKIETLFEYGAIIDVAARDLTPALKEFETEGRIRFVGSEFHEDQMDRAFLVIAATDDPEMNRMVSLAAGERNIPVNAVDQPSDCTFIVPSILRRGDLVIAVSTSGKSPALARRLRERLEGMFGEEYRAYVQLMGKVRENVLSGDYPPERKGEILRELIDSDLLDAIRLGDRSCVASTLKRILRTESNEEIRELIQNI